MNAERCPIHGTAVHDGWCDVRVGGEPHPVATTPTALETRPFRTMADVKQRNAEIGHHFFDADTLRFFSSRIGGQLFGGRYFITSERYDQTTPRRYTVRLVNPDGSIDTVGEFQQYATLDAARRAVSTLLNAETMRQMGLI